MKSIIVIASYPQKNEIHGQGVVGVASYTKELLKALKNKDKKASITVYAETLLNVILPQSSSGLTRGSIDSRFRGNDRSYIEDGVRVVRSWKRNNPISIVKSFLEIRKSKSPTVITSFEINMFGNALSTITALLGLMLLRASGKKTFTIMHQVVKDFNALEKNNSKKTFLNITKSIFYNAISLASTSIIVFEEALKDYLGESIGKKTIVIPHAIFTPKTVSKEKAKKLLGLKTNKTYALYFGFLAPYKGVDKLISSWPNSKNTELIIAGGVNPNHAKNKKIQKYITRLKKKAARKDITITGFVPEELLPLYFAASSVVILPYLSFISSSGPLALAIAFNKPFLLAPALSVYAKTPDIQIALNKASLAIRDVICKITPEELSKKILWATKNSKSYLTFSDEIKNTRSFTKISATYLEAIK